MLGGAAVRPAHFLPIGVSGSTEEIAREIGFTQDLDKAKELLAKAGFPGRFRVRDRLRQCRRAGVTYQDLGQKIQSDLARVGIKVTLRPMDQVNLRTAYTTGKSQGGVLTFWNPPAVENRLMGGRRRAARRQARALDGARGYRQAASRKRATEPDPKKQAELWVEWQKRVVDQANHFILFQPVYQIAVRKRCKDFPLTAAGWMLDTDAVKPA